MKGMIIASLLLYPATALCQPAGLHPDASLIVGGVESLRGITAASVSVSIAGIRDIPESTYRADIETRLRGAGIKILPPTTSPSTYPNLHLSVTAMIVHDEAGSIIGSIAMYELYFWQLSPRKTGARYDRGATWVDSGIIHGPSTSFPPYLRESYLESVDSFVADYRKANR